MNIAPITLSTAATPALQAGGVKPNEAAAQFDAMFYRVLLQSAKWTSGISGGKGGAEQAIFGDMMTDFLAQAAARQQQGLGAILLNAIDQQGKGKS